MRQAINNLQSTWSGFGFVSQDNVFKICDQPHPFVIRRMMKDCQKGEIDDALARINKLWEQGYSAVDIVVTIFRVVKTMEDLPEYTKLEFIRVSRRLSSVRNKLILDRRLAGHTCGYWKVWERLFSSEP